MSPRLATAPWAYPWLTARQSLTRSDLLFVALRPGFPRIVLTCAHSSSTHSTRPGARTGIRLTSTATARICSESGLHPWFVGAITRRADHPGRFKKTGKRNEIFLATKFGFVFSEGRAVNGEPEYVKAACAKSLKRLGVDYIDLYYLHRYVCAIVSLFNI
jgi:hypothetical protein